MLLLRVLLVCGECGKTHDTFARPRDRSYQLLIADEDAGWQYPRLPALGQDATCSDDCRKVAEAKKRLDRKT